MFCMLYDKGVVNLLAELVLYVYKLGISCGVQGVPLR